LGEEEGGLIQGRIKKKKSFGGGSVGSMNKVSFLRRGQVRRVRKNGTDQIGGGHAGKRGGRRPIRGLR